MALVNAPDAGYTSIKIETDRDQRHRVLYAKVDLADVEEVNRYPWHVSWDGRMAYAHTSGRGRSATTMGRLLLGDGELGNLGRVEHRNGNGMDCRRANIRLATQAQIVSRRRATGGVSRYKGVTWDPHQGKWMAVFRGKKVGRFLVEKDAARAFDEAALAHWGPDVYLNFPRRPIGVPMTGARARLLTFAIEACLDTEPAAGDSEMAAALVAARSSVERWVNEPPFWVSPSSDERPWAEPTVAEQAAPMLQFSGG